jgi:hypothetical protein
MAEARLAAQSDEAITDGAPDRRLSAISAESLTTNSTTPSRNLSAISVESLTVAETIPLRSLSGVSIEVLVPAKLTFVGWGTPINTPTWS